MGPQYLSRKEARNKSIQKRTVSKNFKVANKENTKFEEITNLKIEVPGCEPVEFEFLVADMDKGQMIIAYDYMKTFYNRFCVKFFQNHSRRQK